MSNLHIFANAFLIQAYFHIFTLTLKTITRENVFRYGGEWKNVSDCMKITKPFCDITKLIENYDGAYKVRVRLVTPHHQSEKKIPKFYPNKSKFLICYFTNAWFNHTLLL